MTGSHCDAVMRQEAAAPAPQHTAHSIQLADRRQETAAHTGMLRCAVPLFAADNSSLLFPSCFLSLLNKILRSVITHIQPGKLRTVTSLSFLSSIVL